ncbi:MAG: regulatory iron-sulfur-containing complex subunit RicT [Candidatus Marinimicrobia bacterium]|nr:regulatory iron-sulfur-containing complex subunit RicT [Candidatus Neomarinimicrobiota bacterium]
MPDCIPETPPTLIKIEFKGNRRLFYKNDMEYPIQKGDYLVVETEKGEDMGQVTSIISLNETCTSYMPISNYAILRKADETDWTSYRENQMKEEKAFKLCLEKIKELALSMKLMDVEYQLDGKKITFYYTADERVDFRELVRQLAAVLRTRIEMRQIGVRDETKRFGGLGSCGFPLCCATFIEDFDPVTTQNAKDQNLPMNPLKLSGLCGKLKCCLRFEYTSYLEELKKYPKLGNPVFRNGKKVYVVKVDIMSRLVSCIFDDDIREEIPLEEIEDLIEQALEAGLTDEVANVFSEGPVDEDELKAIEDNS